MIIYSFITVKEVDNFAVNDDPVLAKYEYEFVVFGLFCVSSLAVTQLCLQRKTAFWFSSILKLISLFILVAGLSHTPADSKAAFQLTTHLAIIFAHQIHLQGTGHQL